MSYVSSNDNRFYVALEQSYGNAAAVATSTRIPAVKLLAKQQTIKAQRKDKTGARTFLGNPTGLRKQTSFALRTYMATWNDQTASPVHGALFQACLGNPALLSAGGLAAGGTTASQIVFTAPHGLVPGQAISSGGEIRFVAAIVDTQSVILNGPLTTVPGTNAQMGATATYHPATELPSITLFDYWTPASSVQRVIAGAAVDTLTLKVNGDFHEFDFTGPARDLVDSSSFENGQCGLAAYPPEPSLSALDYSIIPGHLGQVWMGSMAERFFTLTDAEVSFNNNLELRAQEFGVDLPMAISPGQRTVTLKFNIFQQDDAATAGLYQAARQQSPISVMLQLGQQQGQLFGLYMKSVIADVPAFDDSGRRQQWQFQSCRAQGSVDDEIFVAFG